MPGQCPVAVTGSDTAMWGVSAFQVYSYGMSAWLTEHGEDAERRQELEVEKPINVQSPTREGGDRKKSGGEGRVGTPQESQAGKLGLDLYATVQCPQMGSEEQSCSLMLMPNYFVF